MKLNNIAAGIISIVIAIQSSYPVFAESVAGGEETASTDTLFCGDPVDMRSYNYCPSTIYEDNAFYVFYCKNKVEGEIRDHIYLSVVERDGKDLVYGDSTLILSPSEEGWDKVHVCDPTVISGDFSYKGTNYKYLMAYLGCDIYNNQHNQVGLALSNELDKGWVKADEVNPFITADYDSTKSNVLFQWGAGQPSLVSIDGSGKVAFFYTRGTGTDTYTECEVWNLSNIEKPIKLEVFRVSCQGTTNGNGNTETLSNADFAYKNGSVYMITDQHPFVNPTTIIADRSDVYVSYIGDLSNISYLQKCVWRKIDSIGEEGTGSTKNHNTGFLRFEDGGLYSNVVLYTGYTNSLWSYRIGIASFGNEDVNVVNLLEDDEAVVETTRSTQPEVMTKRPVITEVIKASTTVASSKKKAERVETTKSETVKTESQTSTAPASTDVIVEEIKTPEIEKIETTPITEEIVTETERVTTSSVPDSNTEEYLDNPCTGVSREVTIAIGVGLLAALIAIVTYKIGKKTN